MVLASSPLRAVAADPHGFPDNTKQQFFQAAFTHNCALPPWASRKKKKEKSMRLANMDYKVLAISQVTTAFNLLNVYLTKYLSYSNAPQDGSEVMLWHSSTLHMTYTLKHS